MAGTAKTSRFNLGSATLMLGSMADVYDLLPATNSVGLIKGFQLNAEPTFADLTQGSKNTTVWSALTGFPVRGNAEVYEYTARNLAYGLSLDGANAAYDPVTAPVDAPLADIADTDTVIEVSDASVYAVNDYIMLYDTTQDDVISVRKVTVVDPGDDEITVDQPIAGAWSMATTAIKIVKSVDIGSTVDQPLLSAVVTGKLADGTRVGIRMPKVRITKGFSLGFNSEQYSNMPFEFELLDLLPTDTFYADFAKRKAQFFTP